MSHARFPRLRFCRLAILSTLSIALLACLAPVGANPIPDAAVYFNVRPAGPPEERCVTDIQYCEQMQSSTPAQGLVEFQIFVAPLNGVHPFWYLQMHLSQPPAWHLVDACFNAVSGYMDGGELFCWWDCWVPDHTFLAATLVYDVQGYGRLEADGVCELWQDCPTQHVVYPTAHFGEAGTECEYTEFACATNSYHCVPELTGLQLQLTVPQGGRTHGEIDFPISGYPFPTCEFTVNSEAPWVTGYVVTGESYADGELYVEADASDLEEGVHESEMQIVYDQVGGWGTLARCLPVILTVGPPQPEGAPVATDPAAVPLDLRLTGASPSSGPFVFAYENAAAASVRCGVYDAAGREVASLLEGQQPAGPHRVTWRAADAAGHPVRPGIYLVRLALDGRVRSSRVVVVL